MATRPLPSHYFPDRRIEKMEGLISDPVTAAVFSEHILRFRNDRWDCAVGLDTLSDDQWVDHFGRFMPLPDNLPQPLALRYHGHQFRSYNPDLGDGRGFLFAQLRDTTRLLDLGTKGSGQTPYSRFGDGRLTLKGGVREVLATEMLEALGVETSKSFSLIETGEELVRHDEPSPTRSAVLVRLSHGHIRIGTFQRLATLGQEEALRKLIAYSLETYFGETASDDGAARLLDLVSVRTADLAASYMMAGFVHGVLNTDNINITGESFDYGPWRFTPTWEPGFTAAYFDQQGLYCFARQAQAIHWNLAQLAHALSSVTEIDTLTPSIEAFPRRFEQALVRMILERLGVTSRGEDADFTLIGALQQALLSSKVGIDRFYFDWRGGVLRTATSLYNHENFQEFRSLISRFEPLHAPNHSYWSDEGPCSMHIEEVETIWSSIADNNNWSPFYAKIDAIRRMGKALRNEED